MVDKSDALATLQESAIGRGLSIEQLDQLMALGRELNLEPGTEIFRQLAPATAVFLPCTGTVMVERSALNGRRQVIAFLRRGNYLGFTATSNYLYSAVVLEPALILKFPRKQFIALCDEIPPLKENMAQINNAVLATLLDHLFAIGQKRAHERVAFLIHQLNSRSGYPAACSPLSLPMSRTDIGDYLGLTLETTSRAFSRLRNDGVIATPHHHSVVILDQEQLNELAEVD